MNRFPKIILSLLLIIVSFFTFAAPISAQLITPLPTVPPNTWYNPSVNDFYDKVVNSPENEIFAERYTFAQVNWIINSLSLMISINLTDPALLDGLKNELFNQKPTSPTLAEYTRFGPAGFLVLSMGDVFKFRPISGVESISSTLAKLDLATPAHAQGYGYLHLSGIQNLWTAARNTAYLVIAVLLIVAGFMIILRQKVSPQAVVTVQMIIPRLIITLILVTFSYAIAGLIIDLVYFTVAIFIASLHAGGVVDNLGKALTYFANPGFYKIILTYLLGVIVFFLNPIVLGVGVGAGLITGGASIVAEAIIILVIEIAVLILLLRVWWMMMKTYITLILLIIIGPWFIMLGLLPNSRVGFGSWFRNILAHASVFAVVPIMFIINLTLYDFNEQFSWLSGTFSALLDWINDNLAGYGYGNLHGGIGNTLPSFPLFGAPSGSVTGFFLSLAILALIPKIADIIRDVLKTPAFKYGSAFGEALGPLAIGTAAGGQLVRGIAEPYTTGAGARTTESIRQGLESIPIIGSRLSSMRQTAEPKKFGA